MQLGSGVINNSALVFWQPCSPMLQHVHVHDACRS